MDPQATSSPIGPTVYFDGSCPLCRREITFYRSLRGGNRIEWVDVSGVAETVAPDLNKCTAMARFHARTPDGTLLQGAAAFAEVWRVLPLFNPLYWVTKLPFALPILDRLYDWFLKRRPSLQRKLTG